MSHLVLVETVTHASPVTMHLSFRALCSLRGTVCTSQAALYIDQKVEFYLHLLDEFCLNLLDEFCLNLLDEFCESGPSYGELRGHQLPV